MDCQSESTLWRIFRDCGHSFHLECNLPKVSVCHLCKSILQSKVVTLGKTANEAVKETVEEASIDDEETNDDEDEASDHVDNEALADQSSCDEHRMIGNLTTVITSWTNVQPPKH